MNEMLHYVLSILLSLSAVSGSTVLYSSYCKSWERCRRWERGPAAAQNLTCSRLWTRPGDPVQRRRMVKTKKNQYSGSGSTSQRYGSGSFYHQAKIVRKTLIPPVLWLLLDFLSLKNDVNVPSKSNKQKNFIKISLLLASWRSMTKTAGSGSGSISQRHGSADQVHTKMSWIRNTEINDKVQTRTEDW